MANEERIVGATIAGKYRIRRIIGGGSMGVVCEAEHLEIGKRVAIKLIDASLIGMKDIAMRFRQEARATSLVESQHIVQVFDVGSDGVLGLYLVMEYLTGEDLSRLLAREKRLSPATATRIALQVARGLAKAHESGIVHRDLKPANIFLCAGEDGQPLVKILDFGISKVVDSSRSGSAVGLKLTRDGMVVGTPQYMSPEQAQGYAVDARSDVWSLGLVLYEMLAGRPAYPELPTYEQFIIHLVSQSPDSLAHVAPWVPEELASVVHEALQHDLAKRIQSCAELVTRILQFYSVDLDYGAKPRAPQAAGAGSDPAARALIASSGVRGTALDLAPPLEDSEDDAPQFFDRKLLQTLHPPSADLSRAAAADPAQVGGRDSPGPSRPEPARRIHPLGWAGLAILVLGLLVAAALAWR
jgi:serine/threonine protein kinase